MNNKARLIYALLCLPMGFIAGFTIDNIIVALVIVFLWSFITFISMFFLCEKFPDYLYKKEDVKEW